MFSNVPWKDASTGSDDEMSGIGVGAADSDELLTDKAVWLVSVIVFADPTLPQAVRAKTTKTARMGYKMIRFFIIYSFRNQIILI